MLAVNATVIKSAYYIYINYYFQEALAHHHSFHGEYGRHLKPANHTFTSIQLAKIASVL